MALFIEQKVLKTVELNEVTLKVTKHEMTGRISVEFKSKDGRITLQKSFQDTVLGRMDSEVFENKIKSLKDLKSYFGLNKKEKRNVNKNS